MASKCQLTTFRRFGSSWKCSAVIAGLLFWFGCGRGPAPLETSRTLTLAVRADVTGFFPQPPIQAEAYTIELNRNVFDTLLRFDAEHRLQPGLAERWETPDPTTCIFTLREGLRFSDGRPLTARDVAASLDAVRERAWVTRDLLVAVVSVQARGDRQVIVRTRTPYFALLPRLAWGFVLPAEDIQALPLGPAGSGPAKPIVGSGPYRLTRWKPGEEIRLERNEHYWGPRPAFGTVCLKINSDDRRRIGMVLDGQADLADQVPPAELGRLEHDPRVRVISRTGLRTLFLCLAVREGPFADLKVRQAVDLALDRDELVRRVFQGRMQVAGQIVPPSVFGHNPSLPPGQPDRRRAAALLAEAGFSAGFKVRLDGPVNRYVNDRDLLVELARQLAGVGIVAEVNALDKTAFFQLVDGGASRLHLLGFACYSGDAGEILEALLHSRGDGPLGSYNSIGLADPELDRLIDESNRAVQVKTRAELLQAAVARVAGLHCLLPLVIQTDAVLIRREVHWEPPLTLSLRPWEMKPDP